MTERDRIYYEMITTAYPLGAEYQELSGIARLADEGYRKEEEVRKETAKAVIEYFETHMICAACEGVIQDAYEKFGVEVEE